MVQVQNLFKMSKFKVIYQSSIASDILLVTLPDADHNAEDQTDTLVEFVDMVMKDQDLNDDGFIDYPEYINYYTKFEKGDNGPPDSQP